MLKKLLILFAVLSVPFLANAQSYPFVLGYAGGQHAPLNDGSSVSFSGGSPFATPWQSTNNLGNASSNDYVLSGFRHDILFVDNAFNADLFASKGYYGDFIQLRWDLVRYAAQATGFRVFRKEVGSTADSVQVANLPSDARSWNDEYAESGVMYQYFLSAEGIFSIRKKFLNYIDGIGFRVPYGRISGRVTYAGGSAVADVSVIAETDDNFSGSSILLNGTDAYLEISPNLNDPLFKLDTAFTFQAWLRPEVSTGTKTLFEKQGQYKLTHSNGTIIFTAGGTQSITLTFPEKVDTFFHVAAMRTSDSLKIMVLYGADTTYVIKAILTATTTANNNVFSIGKSTTGEFFKGYIDEARIWHRYFTEKEITVNSSMYIAGTETYLSAYYRFNEGVGDNFYDLSRKGFTFNEHHGYKYTTAAWSTIVPMARQLAVKGVTDRSGNYIISGIPYSTDGSVYRFVPVYGVHSFDPTEQLLFLGPGAAVHSNIDFIDVASFPVIGEVYYRNTYFPVEGVSIKIDGQTAVTADGLPIITNSAGRFTISVPIGQHYIQLSKNGHGFKDNGRFPATEGTFHDFQQPYTFQTRLEDTTLVKVIGKVVGGPIQAAKPKGMGKAKNNIGNAVITLGTQKGNDLTTIAAGITNTYNNNYYKNGVLTSSGTSIVKTAPTGAGVNVKEIQIQPDVTTGEYVAYLLPEKYTITTAIAGTGAGKYTYSEGFPMTLDLTNSFDLQNEIDSVVTGIQITPLGDTINTVRIDSSTYNKNLDLIYRVNPNISVTNKEGGNAFWETTVRAKDGTDVSVVDGSGVPLTLWPIFRQRKAYELKISVFENYTNSNTAESDPVPVTDGIIEIVNALATQNNAQNFEISSLGVVNYKFNAGLPNIVGDLTGSMSMIAYTGNGGSIQTNWNYTKPGYSGVFKGYVFGGLPTGNNFVTAGPSKIDMILRDPYGTSSYAFYEVGNSVSKTSSYDVSNSEAGTADLTVHLGAKVTTFVGVGAGIITEVETTADATIGLEHSETWLDNNTTTSTTTTTKQWQTSSEIDFVGAPGDVFIGHSTNMVYGISKLLDLIPKAECPGCIDSTGAYKIGIHKTLRVSPEFGTAFQFSLNHIKNYLIPNLEKVRNIYLQNSPYHTSINALGSDDYGKANTTFITQPKIITATDTTQNFTGDSYSIQLRTGPGVAQNWPIARVGFIDSVKHYNEQIRIWKEILAQNEKEKKEATVIDNLSFDAGTIYSSSVTYDSTKASTSTFEFSISPSVSGELGGDVMGLGLSATFSETYTNTQTEANGTETTNSVTFGYELSDPDEGDYFSMDVKQPKSHTGPVFAIRGGQSQCPFEKAEISEFYLPGTILSEATMQREVPQITCASPVQINVPEDLSAIFSVGMGNVSQTDDDTWLVVSVDEQSNQNGALIKMDGTSIHNGRVIFIPGGTSISKLITIEKIDPAINDYEDIGIIIHSACQDDIADTIKLTARFKPVCSKVDVTSPADLWVRNVNTGNNLNVKIDNYDLAHVGFEKILFQYKSASSSAWITDMAFYIDEAAFIADSTAGIVGQRVNGQPEIDYILDMKSIQDRNYNIRALSTCANGTENASVILSGIKDTKRPKVFGTPQPGDGILSPGENVMITFDENIEAGLLLGSNFSVRGVLNGAALRHSAALFFDGADDYASTLAGVNLSDKSFSVEFWTKRGDLNQGVIFSQSGIELGFDASNRFYAKLGSQTQVTTQTYAFTDKWIHFTVSYDFESKLFNTYVAYDGYNNIDLENISFPASFIGNGRMYIGNNSALTTPYKGLLHDFRVWEKTIGYGESNAKMIVSLNGDEIGLSGFWPMNEMNGAFATDLSRSHHAILHGAAWRVFPSGYARIFNGSAQVAVPTASSVIITTEMDYTLEFWFKAQKQTNTVLFSNGKTDITESADALEDIWEVGIDESGFVYTKNNGTTITESGVDYLDDQWHHFALVLRRKGNTSMYFDGKLGTYANSSVFGGFKGTRATIGASKHSNVNSALPYSNYFNGSIDEVRIWNLARTAKLLNMDLNSKLQGDEKGLVAYYPFDKYDVDLILQPSLKDNDVNDVTDSLSVLVATATGGAFDNTNVPNIKDARPAQNLAFNWVVNEDQIIINIEEPASLIEKRVIEFTVDRVEDLNENRLASPETWTAYIKQNTVIWDKNELNFEIAHYSNLSFDVDISNIGGVEQDYSITNLPSWLKASSPVGTLAPDSKKKITFTVSPGTNIGSYEEVLYLTTDFGYNESLFITLKVVGETPDWNFDPNNFQYSMNVIGRIKIDDVVSIDADDKLVAIVDGKVRGIANLKYYENYDSYLAFLDIYSNTVGGEDVKFHVWDASEGKVHTEVTPNITFESNKLIGTPNAPQVFNAINTFSEPITVRKGWNWLSFPLKSKEQGNVNHLLSTVRAADGDVIKGISLYDQYSKSIGWVGSITAAGGVNSMEMYKLDLSTDDTIEYVGSKIDPLETKIAVKVGWNWLGFISQKNLSVADAFTNYIPSQGDLLKGQRSFAIYDSILGWVGNLEYMAPKQGYMFKSAKADTIIYPNSELFNYKKEFTDSQDELNASVNLNPSKYQYNMNIVATADVCKNIEESFRLFAYAGQEIRGVSELKNGKFYLTIFGDGSPETIKYILKDAAENLYPITEDISFEANKIQGTEGVPTKLNSAKLSLTDCVELEHQITAIGENKGLSNQKQINHNSITISPTAFIDVLLFTYELKEKGNVKIEMYDIMGVKMATIIDEYQAPGKTDLRWSSQHSTTDLAAGMYFIRAKLGDDNVETIKILKIK